MLDLNPEWDQIVYLLVHSLSETITLETMDYQHMTNDRSLGYVEVAIKDIARQNVESAEYPFEASESKPREDPIRLSGSNCKGTLHYVAQFIPTFNLCGLTFKSRDTEINQSMAGIGSRENVGLAGNSASMGNRFDPKECHILENGILSEAPTMLDGAVTKDAAIGNRKDNGDTKQTSLDSVAITTCVDGSDNTSLKTFGTGMSATTMHTRRAGGTASLVLAQTGIELSREELMKFRPLANLVSPADETLKSNFSFFL